MPEWYPLISAARYMYVAPWELLEQSAVWRDWALIAQSAEAYAQEEKAKH
jgi:hypothetical protein